MSTKTNSRKAGIQAIHSVDRVVFTVPDLAVAESFYSDFGLDVQKADGKLYLKTFGNPQVWAEIIQADGVKRLQYLRFGIYAEDLPYFRQKIAELKLGVRAHARGSNDGIWLNGPDGFPIQLVVADKASPSVRSTPSAVMPLIAGKGAAPPRSKSIRVKPRHLSHALTFSADVMKSVAFYRDVLGLKLSDHSGEGIAFMHGAHGSDHHLVALAKSHAGGLHHMSWDVGSIEEVGLGGEFMKMRGHKHGWGVGRHVIGSNYFYYVQDPWGSWNEYSHDIDHIPAELEWTAQDHPGEDSFYAWGPEVPSDFVTNHEVPHRKAQTV
jgi:catechol 2,3-dioxygenase-like lactoylglutathione lyase family enzyme